RFLTPHAIAPKSKKPGFCENLPILTRLFIETRFLTPRAIAQKSKKPGFCDNLGIPTEILERNPVSDPHAQEIKGWDVT
ncbi:MAG TPA: hypothetical protein DD001_08115, partial [Microcoleaceae bacterium UBA10368]|nr:hypothetical protein [Microcoleaceae cyanobacterium UBA10368]